MNKSGSHALGWIAAMLAWLPGGPAHADTLSLSMRNVDIAEVMELLSTKERVNIVLGNGVAGEVSVNLYDMNVDRAVRTVADAAGFAVEHRDDSYFIVRREDAGKYSTEGLTELRTFEVHYADPATVGETLAAYLSSYGQVTALPERKLLIVEDTPRFLARVERMLAVLDRQPQQILIEAKILEITLDDTASYGLDWARLFSSDGGTGQFGTQGLSSPGSPGLFFNLSNLDVTVALDALRGRGRVRTLSTPTLLTLENEEASVVVGDRQGFRVTTTINQITTESIEFLESGVILRVTPTVDAGRRIMLEIHPEVSTGTIADGIPSQTTTEVTTRLLVPDGDTVFIGGLIKNSLTETSSGVPVLGSLPGLRRIFSNDRRQAINTETIVLITPRLVSTDTRGGEELPVDDVGRHQEELRNHQEKTEKEIEKLFPADAAQVSLTKEDTTRSEPRLAQHAGDNPLVAAPSEKVATRPDAVAGGLTPKYRWLKENDGAFFALTLGSFSDLSDAELMIERYGDGAPFVAFPRVPERESDDTWLLVYGLYRDRFAAKQAIDDLPGALQDLAPIVSRIADLRSQVLWPAGSAGEISAAAGRR